MMWEGGAKVVVNQEFEMALIYHPLSHSLMHFSLLLCDKEELIDSLAS